MQTLIEDFLKQLSACRRTYTHTHRVTYLKRLQLICTRTYLLFKALISTCMFVYMYCFTAVSNFFCHGCYCCCHSIYCLLTCLCATISQTLASDIPFTAFWWFGSKRRSRAFLASTAECLANILWLCACTLFTACIRGWYLCGSCCLFLTLC